MKNKLLLALLLFVVTACQPKPGFINHPQPNLSITFNAVPDAAVLGCDEIQSPSALLGGLDPSHPIAICIINFNPDQAQPEIEAGQFIYATGGLFTTYLRYVILRDGQQVVIKTADEFRNIYAPIESPEEALSYALALRNLGAYYNLQKDPAYKYEVNEIEDTHVVSEADGYRLNLYSYQFFGCGPHWTSVVELKVAFDGIITEVSGTPVFRDPNMDGLCVD
ncbi:MAG: hypothetical protein HYZ23_09210 [Chloroflexi bacterium]|nr:hypothetical protein [Chloroflexota bacterium]